MPPPGNENMLAEHEIQLRVRYDETDATGFVHHANYLKYFEIGRKEMFQAGGGDHRRLEEEGTFFVVVKVECRYHRPARYDDLINVKVRVTRVTAAKIEHDYVIVRGDERLTEGHVTLAVVDRDGKARRVPDWMHSDLSAANNGTDS